MEQLVKLLEMPDQETVLRYVAEILRPEMKVGVLHVTPDYIYLDTGHPLCLMAHMDTVNDNRGVKVKVSRRIMRNDITAPLGADDRAGVFAALRAYRILKERNEAPPSLLFTTDEESGGLGARKFVADNVFNNDKTHLVLALDRRGASEYVDYTRQPLEVERYVESFGYERKNGSYNDVLDLNSAYQVPGVNLSVGYYSQHTASEKLHVDELFLTISRIIAMCCDPISERHELPKVYNWRANRGQGVQGGWRNNQIGYQGGLYGDDYEDRWSNYNKGPVDKPGRKPVRNLSDLPQNDDEDIKAIDEFFDTHCQEGMFSKHVCPTCLVTWMNCRCGDMLDLFRQELTIEQRDLIEKHWLLHSDPIYQKFADELLEDIMEEDYLAEQEDKGEEEESSEPPIKEVLH